MIRTAVFARGAAGVALAMMLSLPACGGADDTGANDDNFLTEGVGKSKSDAEKARQVARLRGVRKEIERAYAAAQADEFNSSVDRFAFESLCRGEDYAWSPKGVHPLHLLVVEVTFSQFHDHMAIYAHESFTFEDVTFEAGELLHSAQTNSGVSWASLDEPPREPYCGAMKG